jgi:hypothetical protein
MTYSKYSPHRNTNASVGDYEIISSNPYAPNGKTLAYPSKYSWFINKQDHIDGSFSVSELYTTGDLNGSRLYLDHRPVIDSSSNTDVATTLGSINSINAQQGYIEFGTLPTADFTITYTASPDDSSMFYVNLLQDAVMELQNYIGLTSNTTEITSRNLKVALQDKPDASSKPFLDVLHPNALYLEHLNSNLRIGSSTDAAISAVNGDTHTITIGYHKDTVNIDATTVLIDNSDGSSTTSIKLGQKSTDLITFRGELTGGERLTLGDANSQYYTGTIPGSMQTFYDQAVVRVKGALACLGQIQAVGTITIVNTTGEQSSIIGDFKVTKDFTVQGLTHLQGDTDVTKLTASKDIHIKKDLVADNINGSGSGAHSLVDGLDCSEVAATYKHVTAKVLDNCVIRAPMVSSLTAPIRSISSANYTVNGELVPGSVYMGHGTLTAAPSTKPGHPSVLQINLAGGDIMNVVTGSIRDTSLIPGGTNTGIWSDGLVDPGNFRMKLITGAASGWDQATYSHTIEAGSGNTITKFNTYHSYNPTGANTGDEVVFYNKGSEPYSYISTSSMPGTEPNVVVTASASDPIVIAFKEDIRILKSNATVNIKVPLQDSVVGLGTDPRGECFIFASKINSLDDPEAEPTIIVRAHPVASDDEVLLGSIVADLTTATSTWTLVQAHSVRPGGYYDSSWIPVLSTNLANAGRVVSSSNESGQTYKRLFFYHGLGDRVTYENIIAKIYYGTYYSVINPTANQNHVRANTIAGNDSLSPITMTGGTSGDLEVSDPTIFYIDDKIIGILYSDSSSRKFMRLVVRRVI